METNVKNWYESKAVWANLLGGIIMALSMFGLVSNEKGKLIVEQGPEFLVMAVGVFMNMLGLYGRVTARSIIGSTAAVAVSKKPAWVDSNSDTVDPVG
jgi:hypothetical protein